MGLFDFFKSKRPSSQDQAIVDQIAASIKNLAESPMPQPISQEEYAQLRQKEIDWLERKYDFNTIEGIKAIPDVENPPRPSGDSTTGDVYYYLKAKAHEHEKVGNIELAIACFEKSIRLMRLKFRKLHGRAESYSYVRMLARNGYLEAANKEKKYADKYYGPDPMYKIDPKTKIRDDGMIDREYQKWQDKTTLDWLQQNFPDKSPKTVTSFRRMRTQNTKNYQLLKQLAAEKGQEI